MGAVSLAFSPDGKTLACAGADSIIRSWSLATGKVALVGQASPGMVVALAADATELAVASYPPFQGGLGGGFRGGFGGITGGLIGFQGATIRLFEPALGMKGRLFARDARTQTVAGLAFSPDKKTLAIAGSNFIPGNGFSGGLGGGLNGFAGGGLGGLNRGGGAGFGLGGGGLAGFCGSGGGFGSGFQGFGSGFQGSHIQLLGVWEKATGRPRWKLEGQPGVIRALAFSQDGKVLAVGTQDGTLSLFNSATGEKLSQCVGHSNAINSLAFSASSAYLASAGDDGTARLWNATGLLLEKRTAARPKAEELRAWRAVLSDPDPSRAWPAMERLLAAPDELALLAEKELRPDPDDDPRLIAQLIADLASRRFAARRRATLVLEKLGEKAEPLLRKTLESRPTDLELYLRLEHILAKRDAQEPAPAYLRALRALELLERSATSQARRVLAGLANGPADLWQTREARASLERLARRK
jgi:hypothetical protein